VWKVSLSNGTTIQYSMAFHDWITGQPNYYKSGYGKMSCLTVCSEHEYKWNDDKCSLAFCYICEIQPY